ncbi:Lsr2 family protein [Spongisporangium articulatum]|uniref:Lsr2 family protein n=1 Tax=Spongisporangium articulatum TaxID=3362603 RepID=A0ABW8AL48_9ACTN
MATQTITEFLDDTDGTPAAETVSFGLDGIDYEIDLSAANAEALRAALAPWQAPARRLTRRGAPHVQVSTGVDTRAVRAWAASNGVDLPARGRIPAAVIEQYRAAGH